MQSLAELLGTVQQAEDVQAQQGRKRALSVKALSRMILTSPDYLSSLDARIRTGTLAPAVEIRLWDLAYGKPVDRVEWKDKTNPLEEMTTEQLEQRAARLLEMARTLRSEEAAEAAPDSTVH